ncbi:hypothetical protein PENTCL1PPCAC_17365 [Pristionchus entomophagus]|uniref:GSKIP domain-containing protein n=1 Tax=Pristionchus entomophagus TaxID=358040 RepID=A0AAV5TLN3_9BILA|nr:hypothetical protein PENTCL1PPCAC_17365 [Pristionchus entomophagus]
MRALSLAVLLVLLSAALAYVFNVEMAPEDEDDSVAVRRPLRSLNMMDGNMAESPPNTPEANPSIPCVCGSMPLISANTLADSLGVSPAYKQADSARWTSAVKVYKSSRAHSPINGRSFDEADEIRAINKMRTPLSLEDIARENRRRHEEEGGVVAEEDGGPLELEAIAAVHELATDVDSISVSEMLPRTRDLIFVNVKTQEDQPYTLELTMKGWRVASRHSDCMYGDYTQLDLHVRYYMNARELLNVISPTHCSSFHQKVTDKLTKMVDANA